MWEWPETLAASEHGATIMSQKCDHWWKQGDDKAATATAGYLLASEGHNLYKSATDGCRNNIMPRHELRVPLYLDSMDIRQECILQAIAAVLLTDVTPAFSYSSACLCFTGLAVQLSVFLRGQMELQQHSPHVRSSENLLFLPARGAQRAGGFSLPGWGHRKNMQQQSIKDKAHSGWTHGATFRSTRMRNVCTHNTNRVHGGGTTIEVRVHFSFWRVDVVFWSSACCRCCCSFQ